jgi:hypothetical protein
MTDKKMEAKIFFESHLPDALRLALEYAGDDGYVASMPQLLHAQVSASYDNEIWNIRSFTSNSEENVVKTKRGNHVVVTVHGGGIFASPERFKKLYYASVDRSSNFGFTGMFGAKLSEQEAQDVVEGKLPDGTEIPIYAFDEFKQGIANLPRRYAVVMDFEVARKSNSRNETFDNLKDDPLMIVRAGGANVAAAYLDKVKGRKTSSMMANWHNFDDIDPNLAQTRILLLGGKEGGVTIEDYPSVTSEQLEWNLSIWGTHYRVPIDAEYGIRGDAAMINMARYVAVAPRDVSTSVRNLDFEV